MALIKDVEGKTLRNEWRIISLVFAQLMVVVLIAFQAMQIVGLHVNIYLRQFLLRPNPSAENLVVLAIAVILFFLLYLTIRKRQPALFQAEKKAPSTIKQEAREKLRRARKDPRIAALLLIDFAFVVVVVLALRAYLDPETEIIPWSRAGIAPPFTTAINAVIAVIVLALFYFMYRYTASYRKG